MSAATLSRREFQARSLNHFFPSASGVNPMVTIAALAHCVAQPIKARL